MLRQQGSMVTDAPEFWGAEYRRRNDLAHECQNPKIGVQRFKLFLDLRVFEGLRLVYGNAEGKGFLFDRIDFASSRIGRTVNRENLLAFARSEEHTSELQS